MLYLDGTSDYLRRQKQKHTIGRHTTPIPDTLPIKYLKPQQSNLTMYNNYIELNDYVKRLWNKNSGRVSWKQCFKQGHEEEKAAIMQFSTSESLRSQYNKRTHSFATSTMPITSTSTMPSASTSTILSTNTCEIP